jgi:hypothetical protein
VLSENGNVFEWGGGDFHKYDPSITGAYAFQEFSRSPVRLVTGELERRIAVCIAAGPWYGDFIKTPMQKSSITKSILCLFYSSGGLLQSVYPVTTSGIHIVTTEIIRKLLLLLQLVLCLHGVWGEMVSWDKVQIRYLHLLFRKNGRLVFVSVVVVLLLTQITMQRNATNACVGLSTCIYISHHYIRF